MALQMDITLPQDQVLVLHVVGDASTGTIFPLQQKMDHILEAYPDRTVLLVDLSALSFASSTMLGTLLRFRGHAQELGHKVVIVISQSQLVYEAFLQANLDKILPQYDTIEQAIKATAPSSPPPEVS